MSDSKELCHLEKDRTVVSTSNVATDCALMKA